MKKTASSKQNSAIERLYAIAPVGLCYFDTELRFRYINEWLAHLNGLPVEAHLGNTVQDLLKDVAKGVVPQLRDVLETGKPVLQGKVAAETPAHPGELRHYLHNYYPDMNEDGTIVGISCVIQDITKYQEADQRIRESEARLVEAQRLAKVGSWEKIIGTDTASCSEEGYRILEIDPQPSTELFDAFLKLVHPDDRQRVSESMAKTEQHGEPYDITHRLLLPDGRVKIVRDRAEAVLDETGRPTRLVGTFQDITDQVELERSVVTAGERERLRIGRDLHDGLGQELAGFSFSLHTLSQSLAKEHSAHQRPVENLAVLAQKMVAQTRDFARQLSPVFSTELGLCDALRALIAEINENSNVACRAHCSFDEDIYDEEIATHLYRIAQESISNAIKHSGAQNIDVYYGRDGDSLFLEVLDDGSGIPAKQDRSEGMGLKNMYYRARILHGRLEVGLRSCGGTRVLTSCPVSPD